MKLPKTLIIVFFYIILSNVTMAQFKYDKFPNGAIKNIIFSNGTKYDLSANNPFLLDKPADRQINSTYKYRNVKISEIKTIGDQSLIRWRKGKMPEKERTIHFSTFPVMSDKNGFFVISYLWLAYNDMDESIGHTSKIIVLDSLGNIHYEKQFEYDCFSVNITSDGKTLGFMIGGIHDESLNAIVKPCATFYDIAGDSVILKLYAEDSTYFCGLGVYNNILFVKLKNGYKNETKVYFFLAVQRSLYSIVLNAEQRRRILEFNNQGIFLCNSRKDKTIREKLLFTRDFKREDLP